MGLFEGVGNLQQSVPGGKFLESIISALVDALGLDDSSVGGKFDKTYISGYEYYAGLHIGVCHGPVDRVEELLFRGKTGWKGVAAFGAMTVDAPGWAHNIPRDQEHPRSGNEMPTSPNVIVVNQPNLFGGEKVSGGVLGIVDVLHGARDQGYHPYLTNQLRPHYTGRAIYTPAYRGILSLVLHSNIKSFKEYVTKGPWRHSIIGTILAKNRNAKLTEPATNHTGFYWGAMDPSLKEVAVRVFRALQGWNCSGGCWYPEKAIVIRNGREYMNAIHIIVQCLVDLRAGMKLPLTQIGESFIRCADQCHHTDYVDEYGDTRPGEAIGLGLIWDGETQIRDFIFDVARYVNGNVYIDPVTGKLEIALVRPVPEDHIEDLPLLTESQIIDFGAFSRPLGEEAVNTINLVYSNYDSEKTETISRNNSAMVSIYGTSIPQTLEMPGIKDSTLAAQICEREVRQHCSLAGRYSKMRVSRLTPTEGANTQAAFTFYEGAPFRLRYLEHGIDGQVFRVANINLKTLEENYIEFDAVEDSFALVESPYIFGGPESGWVNTNQLPDNFGVGDLRYLPTPYVSVLAAGGTPLIQALPTSTRLFTVLADRDDRGITQTIEVWSGYSSSSTLLAEGVLCPTSELDGDLPILDNKTGNTGVLRTTVKMKNMSKVSEYSAPGAWFVVDDEKILCVSVVDDDTDPDYLLMTLERGLFDSVPADHADGAKMWWYNGISGARYTGTAFQTTYPASLYVRPIGRIGGPSLDVNTQAVAYPGGSTSGPALWALPYPAAAISQGGVLLNQNTLKNPLLEWACRNRINQSDVPVAWDYSGVIPEDGTTYTIKVYRIYTASAPGPYTGVTTLVATYTNIGAEGPNSFFRVTDNVHNPAPGNLFQQYYKIRISITANREGFESAAAIYDSEWIVGYGYGYGYGYGGMSDGQALLNPGDTLSPVDYDQTKCYSPMWVGDQWIHCDAFQEQVGGSRGDSPVTASSTYIYYCEAAMTEFSYFLVGSNTSSPGLHNNTALAGARFCGSIGAGDLNRLLFVSPEKDRAYYSGCRNVAANSGVAGEFDLASESADFYSYPPVIDFITSDATNIVISANKGADILTATVASFSPAPGSSVAVTRVGTANSPNPVSSLMQVEFIKYIGTKYIAVGKLNTDYTKVCVAHSTDLLSWALYASDLPQRAADPFAWQYYPETSDYFIFDTVGDPDNGGGVRAFRTANGYDFSNYQIGLSTYAPCLGNALIYYMEGSGSPFYRMVVHAGAKTVYTDDGVIWSAPERSTLSPLQVEAIADYLYEPFIQNYPGEGAYATDSPTTLIPLAARKTLFRTGVQMYSSRLPQSHPGYYHGGSLIDIYNMQIAGPAEPKYTKVGGCLPDYADGSMYDSGFSTGGIPDYDVHGLVGRKDGDGKRYFEVLVGGEGLNVVGVVAAAAPGEAAGITSVLIDADGVVLTDVILTCPGGMSGGSVKLPTALADGTEGVMVSIVLDPAALTCKIFLDGSLTPYKTITGLKSGLVWFPVFTSVSAPMKANLGQKAFQFPGVASAESATAWL